MRDIVLEETIYLDFTTRAATGVPTLFAGSPVLSVLEENNVTPITSGVSVSVSRASVAGLNMATIVATAANGYELGKGYSVYISAGTVGGVSVIGEKVAEFTIGASSATQDLANGTDGLTALKTGIDGIPITTLTEQEVRDSMELAPTVGTPATDSIDDKLDTILITQDNQNPVEQLRTSDVVTTGTETGTSANTLLQDGTLWTLTSVSGGIDAEVIFNIGTDSEIPSSTNLVAYFDSAKGRVLQIQAFNFNQNDYENRGGVQNDATSLRDITLGLTENHVKRGQAGTPGVNGDVRIRFLYDLTVSGKVSAGDDWNIDVASVSWIKEGVTLGSLLDVLANSNPQRNYPLAAITIDTENGVPGTELGINGTPGNPSNNIVDSRILADELGFNRYALEGFVTELTLDQNYDNWQFISSVFGGTVNGASQSTDGAVFVNMQLAGVFVGEIDVTQCSLKGLTTEGFFQNCTLPQNPSVTLTGSSNFRDCDSTLPGIGNPGVDANNVVGLSVSFTKYGGGLDLANLDDAANVTVSGKGSVNLTDAATTATVIISGNMRLTGTLPTGIVLIDAARIDTGQLDESLTTLNDISVSDILTTQMTEAYAANGVAPTLAQAMLAVHQYLMQFGISGTAYTVKELDNSTTAFVVTLDDANDPTSGERV